MSRKVKSESDLFDDPDHSEDENSEPANHLDRTMSLFEDAGIEYSVKKASNGKTLLLDNSIVFRFNHDGELTAIDK